MHIVPLLTVQHTGTWFMMEFLRGTESFKHEVDLAALIKNRQFLTLPNNGPIGAHPSRINLVYGHINEPAEGYIRTICAWWRPIVPLRDPLLGIITGKNRNPAQDCSYIVERWLRLEWLVDPFAPHYIPLDLLRTPEERGEALADVLEATQVSMTDAMSRQLNLWANTWPQYQYNSRGTYPLKVAYYNRDMKYIEKHGNMANELMTLRGAESVLRPLLFKQGYRDLMWWTPGGAKETEAA